MSRKEIQDIIGQLFILGFQGNAVTPELPVIADIARHNLGGVILFDRHLATGKSDNNILGKAQLKELTTGLQHAVRLREGAPLLIAIDQEGGAVSRLKKERGFTETPAAAELGADSSMRRTREAAARTAALLQESGINLNFAPVVDLDVFPENPIIGRLNRSFGGDAENVARHCAVWIEEHHNRGILTCLKHFPGHGSSRADSHLGFVDISETWQKEELLPYQLLARKQQADAIMLGHLFHRQFDEKYPATLSAKTIAFLRQELKLQSLLVSDDMQMKAITQQYGLEEACSRSINAGADIIIIGNNLEYDPAILEKIKVRLLQDIEKGLLDKSRILESWQRVKQFKNRIPRKQRKANGAHQPDKW